MKAINLIGKIFGDYKVIKCLGKDSHKHVLWEVECVNCGNKKAMRKSELEKNVRTHCTKCNKAPKKSIKNIPVAINTAFGKNIKHEEKQINILNMPCYYTIVHALSNNINCQATKLGRQLNDCFKLQEKIDDLKVDPNDLYPGCLIKVNNIWTIVINKGKEATTYEDIITCGKVIAQQCKIHKITHLAMTRIGTGKGKLNWNRVKNLILAQFNNVYKDSDDYIYITFCDNTNI